MLCRVLVHTKCLLQAAPQCKCPDACTVCVCNAYHCVLCIKWMPALCRGIDVVRNKIKMFAHQKVTLPKGRHKIIILDEADRYSYNVTCILVTVNCDHLPCRVLCTYICLAVSTFSWWISVVWRRVHSRPSEEPLKSTPRQPDLP